MFENHLIIFIGITILFVTAIYFYFTLEIKKREKARKLQELLDSTDELTQINNRQYIDFMLEKELDRTRRHGDSISFVIIEIDGFSAIKEEYGEQFSKRVLKETAENLQERIRAYDILARDKHRFLCLFPETDTEAALLLSKRARAIVAAENYYFRVDGDPIHVTACIGVTSCKPTENDDVSPGIIIATANRALGRAKKKGPNNMEFIIMRNRT